jgi:thioredoxin reductase (NADPH)
VHLIHRRDRLRASPIIQQRALANPKIEPVWNRAVEEIVGDTRGVRYLRLRDTVGGAPSTLEVTGVFVFIGFTPNTGIIKGHFQHDAAGYVITDAHMMTSIPGLFAAGDLRVQLTRQITTAVGDATTAAIAVEKYLAARKEKERAPVGAA